MSGRLVAENLVILLLVGFSLSGCYYGQLAKGQYDLLSRREPIAKIVGDDQRDPALRDRLRRVLDARRYAVEHLALPDNGSYQFYSDLGRPYVVWNLFATPELSLQPLNACFLIVGCVAYRGFYEQKKAEAAATSLRAEGYDVYIGGVPAYSTLGWFDDPVLNTMLRWSEGHLIGTVFHELAHQKIFIKSDTAFNESFASFVEQEGLRQYQLARAIEQSRDEQRQARSDQITRLILSTRERLSALYASTATDDEMRSGKQAEFERLRSEYRRVRDQEWNGDKAYDSWFEEEWNNARLLPFGLYDEWVPSFAALFRDSDGDWYRFYKAVAKLGALKSDDRLLRLKALQVQNEAVSP